MSMEIFNCDQGSDEWFLCRAGIPTASMFDTVMACGKGGGPSKTRRTYMMKLLGERLTGQPTENYTNAHMERGKVMEEEARNAYAMIQEIEPQKIGFIRNGDKGCSPDSFIDISGLLEIKTKLPHLQLEVLLCDEVPSEHKAQIQGQLWVAEREYCDFVSYWPRLRPFIKRVYRDEKYIAELSNAVDQFNDELNKLQNDYMRVAA